jgi:hypothetical protein
VVEPCKLIGDPSTWPTESDSVQIKKKQKIYEEFKEEISSRKSVKYILNRNNSIKDTLFGLLIYTYVFDILK